jgi:hypothetical protein
MRVVVATREVEFQIKLSQKEGVELYWGLSDLCGVASERPSHPRLVAVYALFDKMYEAGAADMSREMP